MSREGMNRFNFFGLIAFLLSVLQTSHTQVIECCGSTLLDTLNNVVIENGRPLTPGTYRAMTLKICTTEPLRVQVWTKVTEDQFTLKWSYEFNATLDQVSRQSVVLTFPTSSFLTISSNDYLGLFAPGNTYNKIPIPYSDDSGSSVRISTLAYNMRPFSLPTGNSIQLQSWLWRRSFTNYLKFCSNNNSCPAISTSTSQTLPVSYSKFVTVPATCCGGAQNIGSCDPTNQTTYIIDDQQTLIDQLITRINRLKKILDDYKNGRIGIGFCPDNTYELGTYGLQYCYKFFNISSQLAQANILCSADLARVVFIQDKLEDQFIKDFVTTKLNVTRNSLTFRVWTSAIYSLNSKNWYWFNNLLPRDNLQPFGAYVNWKDRNPPIATSELDVCATYYYDYSKNTYYWEKTTCTTQLTFICKIRKLCN